MKEKQIGRYLRYKMAFERMDNALEEGWLLEAITLEESIISDRLIAIISNHNQETPKKQSLFNLISKSREIDREFNQESFKDVFDELDNWRILRNECVHGFCKLDDYATDTRSAEMFSEKLWETASQGRELVNLIRSISNKMKT